MTVKLKYGNTNTYYIPGRGGGLLVDTDYAGTLGAFYRALKLCILHFRSGGVHRDGKPVPYGGIA